MTGLLSYDLTILLVVSFAVYGQGYAYTYIYIYIHIHREVHIYIYIYIYIHILGLILYHIYADAFLSPRRPPMAAVLSATAEEVVASVEGKAEYITIIQKHKPYFSKDSI